MLPLLALAAFQNSGGLAKDTTLDGLLGSRSLMIHTPVERLATPKRSPKNGWEFDWTVAGYAGDANRKEMRFDLYSQESTVGTVRPESVMRLLLRLFSYNKAKLRIEHATDFARVVTAYLCYGGEAGGEQLFDVDHDLNDSKVDTIYFYDLRSFTDPVEITREVAHEYGHATLPPIGGYTAPESWANGYLGEKLYMTYLADARAKGELAPAETFGASPELLHAWVRRNVDPLVEQALVEGPRPSLLAGKDKAAMDAFFGLALATARLYGPKAMIRALFTIGTEAKGFPEAASVAAAEPALVTLDIPASLRSRPIWVPLGTDPKKNRIMGAAVLERRKDGWVRIRPGKGDVLVRNYAD